MSNLKKLSLALLICSFGAAIPDLIELTHGQISGLLPYKMLAVLICVLWWYGMLGGFSRGGIDAKHRVELHVFPNAIGIKGEQPTPFDFSGYGRFVLDKAQLGRAFHAMADTLDGPGAKVIVLRRSALVRIYPGNIGITNVEMDAVFQAAATVFKDLEVSVEDEDFRGIAHPSPTS